jgi:excisionase family DNA binding protein
VTSGHAGAGARGAGDSFYTAAEVAAHYGCTPRRIFQLIEAGAIPSVRLGRRRLVPRAEWDAMRGLSAGGISLADQGGPTGVGLITTMTRDEAKGYLLALARRAQEQTAAARGLRAQARAAEQEAGRLLREITALIDQLPGGATRIAGAVAVLALAAAG